MMLHPTQVLEPPANPGRFIVLPISVIASADFFWMRGNAVSLAKILQTDDIVVDCAVGFAFLAMRGSGNQHGIWPSIAEAPITGTAWPYHLLLLVLMAVCW
jgi:hypothetical protein